MPFDRFLNLIYHWLTAGAEQAEIDKFDTKLWRPPPGVAPAPNSPWSAESERAAFKSFAAAFSSTVGNAQEGSVVGGSA